jgi:hypothetical protein
VDGESEASPLGQVGYAITGSGGGGAGGQYVFADLAELTAILTEAEAILDEIRLDWQDLRQARQLVRPPAQDVMSRAEARITAQSLDEAVRHNIAMADYMAAELAKLRACRDAYVSSGEESAARLRKVDGD